jgi:hypothetical protein
MLLQRARTIGTGPSGCQSGCKEPVRHRHSSKGEGGAGRFAAEGLEKPEVYSLEYDEDFSRLENKVDVWPSFAAVERSMSERLLGSSFS